MHTIYPPKLPLLFQNVATNTCSKIYNERMGERGRKMGEIWHSKLALRIDEEMRRGSILL
jgi:hypothetical protein